MSQLFIELSAMGWVRGSCFVGLVLFLMFMIVVLIFIAEYTPDPLEPLEDCSRCNGTGFIFYDDEYDCHVYCDCWEGDFQRQLTVELDEDEGE